jgi:basic membrane lipoprotein Med (substrate-binding protein (PBP1-ABC) superfamily)
MQFSLASTGVGSIVLLLSCLSSSILASPIEAATHPLAVRQAATTSCAEYSMIANYSTIGTNSSYRSAFMQASPQGGDPTTAILDGATKKLPTVKFDKALNDNCGNLTTLAVKEAEVNFTMGIVGGFTMKKAKSAAARMGSEVGTVGMVVLMVGAGLLL